MLSFKDVEETKENKKSGGLTEIGSPSFWKNKKIIVPAVIFGVAIIGGYIVYKKVLVKKTTAGATTKAEF